MSEHEHVLPLKTYYLVFAALMVLLALTVAAAKIEHSSLNIVIAMAIAITKAVLIVLFFMHVKYNPFVIRVAVLAGVFWFGIMVVHTMSDYLTRSRFQQTEQTEEAPIPREARLTAPESLRAS